GKVIHELQCIRVGSHCINWRIGIAEDWTAIRDCGAERTGRVAQRCSRICARAQSAARSFHRCVRLAAGVAIHRIDLPSPEQPAHEAILTAEERQFIENVNGGDVGIIKAAVGSLRSGNAEWILRISQSAAAAHTIEYFAGSINLVTVSVGSSGGDAVEVLYVEP